MRNREVDTKSERAGSHCLPRKFPRRHRESHRVALFIHDQAPPRVIHCPSVDRYSSRQRLEVAARSCRSPRSPCTTFADPQLHGVWSFVSLGHTYISASGLCAFLGRVHARACKPDVSVCTWSRGSVRYRRAVVVSPGRTCVSRVCYVCARASKSHVSVCVVYVLVGVCGVRVRVVYM